MFCILLIGILCTGITIVSYNMYKNDMIGRYAEYEKTILNLALSSVDSEGIQEAVKTQIKNKAYQKLQKKFNQYVNHSSIQYIYALYFKENDDNMYYVLNGYTEEMKKTNPEGIHQLGELPLKNDFSKDMIEELRTAFEKKTKEVQYIKDMASGNEYLMTAYYPLVDKEGNTVCICCVDILMEDIHVNLRNFVETVVIWVALLGLIFLVGFLFIVNRRIVLPVKKLADSAKNFITQQEKGKPEELIFKEVPIHSKDEIQLLSDSLSYMVSQLKEYMEHVSHYAAEQERVSAQFRVVQQLKENLFPFQFPAFAERTDFEIYARIEYSKVLSGDFYDFFLIDSNHLCFFVGNASGSGITTTMVAMIATIYMENYARLGYLPNRILGEVNNQLSENNRGEITVSAFLGIVNLETGEFTFSQAGELCPLMKCSGREAELLACNPGFPLGSLENVVYFQHAMHLKQGESVFLYTKGVSGKKNKNGYEFTDEYVLQAWNSYMREEYVLCNIIDRMQQKLNAYAGGVEREMDETMLAFRYLG